MAFKGELLWQYKTLGGLYTNKTPMHQDREGFNSYYNIENLISWERMRRSGSSLVHSYTMTENPDIKYYANYHYFDTTKSQYRYKLMLFSANKIYQYYYNKDTSSYYFETITMPASMTGVTDNLVSRWKAVSYKNRLLICTSIHSNYTISPNNAYPNPSNSFEIKFVSAIPVDLKNNIRKGDIITLDGAEYKINQAIDNYTISLEDEYSGFRTQSNKFAGGAIFLRRPYNFLIYDPNDNRDKTGKSFDNYLSRCGAVAPATQMVADTELFWDEDYVQGWVFRGWYSSTALQVFAQNNMAYLYYCPTGKEYVWKDKYLYIIENSQNNQYQEYKIVNIVEHNYTSYSHYDLTLEREYEGATETLTGNPPSNNRWKLYYGKLQSQIGYKYCYAYYNSHTGHMSNHSPVIDVLTPFKCFNVELSSWDSLIDNVPNDKYEYDTIILFRSVDGGTTMMELKRIQSTNTQPYYDSKTDDQLGYIIAEKYLHNPPPEFIDIEEYRGRIWGINVAKDKIYYSCDEAQVYTARAEECYPETNYITVPVGDGEFRGLLKAGDYLYVATNRNLYVLLGQNEYNFTLEKIVENAGIKSSQYMCEYQGALSSKPGLFYYNINGEAWIITPDGRTNIGFNIEDKLRTLTTTASEIFVQKIITSDCHNLIHNGIYYNSIKSRNYIGIFYVVNKVLGAYIYDCDFNVWYQHEFNYSNSLYHYLQPLVINSLFEDNSIPFGLTYYSYGATKLLKIIALYNKLEDYDNGIAYDSYLRTTWLDFDNLTIQKAPIHAKIYSNVSSGFNIELYKNGVLTPLSLINSNFVLDVAPHLEYNYELIADLKTQNEGYVASHSNSLKITYPQVAEASIYSMEFLFQQLSAEALNR